MNRRRFMKTVTAGAVTAPITKLVQRASSPFPEMVVVGAGAFGSWTALSLVERGYSVTLVDAFGAGNSRATSGGETRQIRVGYGERELYSRWVLKAYDLWREREAEWGVRLMMETGRLLLSPETTASIKATKAVLDKLAVPVEELSPRDIEKRFPQLRTEGVGVGLLEPTAAVIRARTAVQEVTRDFRRKGGTYTIARADRPGAQKGGRLESLTLSNGETLVAEQFIFACGPWLRNLFPELLGKKLFVPRRDVFFFGTPSGDERFTYPNLPNYSEADYYGFSSIDGRGFKVCPTGELTHFDPDGDERLPSPWQLTRARAYLKRRFPGMRDQPLVESRVCQLEMTTDEHFIVQTHPAISNVWIAGGGSGHGFKHGPVLGDYIASRVLGEDRQSELEDVFKIKEQSFHVAAAIR